MMGSRDFGARAVAEWLDPLGVLLFSLVLLFVLGFFTMMYMIHQKVDNREAFEKVCIDAGGYPVESYHYIKGSTDGHLCINPSAIIQLKD